MVRVVLVLALVCAFSMVQCRPAPDEEHHKSKRWIFEANRDPVLTNHRSTCASALSDYVAGRITMYEYRTLIRRCQNKDTDDMRRRTQVIQPQAYNYNGYYANIMRKYPGQSNVQYMPAMPSMPSMQSNIPTMHSQSSIEFNQPYQQQTQAVFMQRSHVPIQHFRPQTQMVRQWSMQPIGTIRNQMPGQFTAGFQQPQQPMFPENQ